MMNRRDHALFLGSMLIWVTASQATMVVDASVGGNLLGADAVSAVNLAMPVHETSYILVTLLGMGACTAASPAFGRGDTEAVRRHFTGAILSFLAVMLPLCAAIHCADATLADLLCDDSGLRTPMRRYLHAMPPYLAVAGVQTIGMMFTAMAGHPLRAMCCSLLQFAVNLSCNLLLIGRAGLGIEALAYSSLLASIGGLLVLMPTYLSKDCPFRMIRCPSAQLRDAIRGNVRFGSGFLCANVAYLIMIWAMNTLVLEYQGEEGLLCWSVTMMMYLTGDYASSAANATSLSLGGRHIGAGDKAGAKMVYDRSLIFALTWIGGMLTAVLALPRFALPVFGIADASAYPALLSFLMSAVPFIAGTSVGNLYLVRLVPNGAVGAYSVLSSMLFIAVPVLFVLFHMFRPGCERYAFLALLPVQTAICLIGRRRHGISRT